MLLIFRFDKKSTELVDVHLQRGNGIVRERTMAYYNMNNSDSDSDSDSDSKSEHIIKFLHYKPHINRLTRRNKIFNIPIHLFKYLKNLYYEDDRWDVEFLLKGRDITLEFDKVKYNVFTEYMLEEFDNERKFKLKRYLGSLQD